GITDINSLFGRMASLSRRLCSRETAHALVKKKGKAKDEYYGKLILDLGYEVHSSVKQGTTAMENLNEPVKRDLYWTRVRTHEFYQEMIRRRFMFEERPNEAIDVPIEDEKSPSSEPRGSPRDSYVDDAITAEQARHANAGNDARGFGPFMGQDAALVVHDECVEGKKVKFAAATLEGPALTWWNSKIATLGLKTVNQMPQTEMKQLMTSEMVEPESVNVDAYIRGLTDNIKGGVTSSRPANLNEAVRKAHKLMEQKSQIRDERILEGKKRKWESFQSGNSNVPQVWKGWAQGKKVKQEETKEVRGQAYAIKDAEPQGLNVVTGMFLLNNRYASVLLYSGVGN
ncbi:hypothetical protein Tco_0763652, partial [Tanacetum coccineum]